MVLGVSWFVLFWFSVGGIVCCGFLIVVLFCVCF